MVLLFLASDLSFSACLSYDILAVSIVPYLRLCSLESFRCRTRTQYVSSHSSSFDWLVLEKSPPQDSPPVRQGSLLQPYGSLRKLPHLSTQAPASSPISPQIR